MKLERNSINLEILKYFKNLQIDLTQVHSTIVEFYGNGLNYKPLILLTE